MSGTSEDSGDNSGGESVEGEPSKESSSESELSEKESESEPDEDDDFNPFGNGSDSDDGELISGGQVMMGRLLVVMVELLVELYFTGYFNQRVKGEEVKSANLPKRC